MPPDDVWKRLSAKLSELGVDDRALKAAQAEGLDGLRRLVARYVAFPGERKYAPKDLYERHGVDEESAQALWRAMGFPLVPLDEVAFTDADLEAVVGATKLFDLVGMDREIVLQQARAMGQTAARIASSHLDVIAEVFREGDLTRSAEEALRMADEALPSLDRLLVYMYRRHLAAATEQRMFMEPGQEGGVAMSVGFADLSGFTALSQELDVRELAVLIDRFNTATSDVVSQAGGRVIKTIGDEVMFATPDVASGATISLTLIGEAAEGLPALKIGLATGPVIQREGDLFGSPVNLASRLVTTAKPGSVLVDESTRNALADDERFLLTSIGRRHLKGFGLVRSYRLRTPGKLGSPRRHRERRRGD
jgi:adenylate cyclase